MPAAAAWINPSVETNEVGTTGVVSLSETFQCLFLPFLLEPSKVVQICLPRFASNRHGFELHYVVPNVPKGTEKVEPEAT